MASLLRRLLSRRRQGATEGFVVGPDNKRAALEHVAEVLDGQEDSQQLPVKCTVLHLRGGELLRKERQWRAVGAGQNCPDSH